MSDEKTPETQPDAPTGAPSEPDAPTGAPSEEETKAAEAAEPAEAPTTPAPTTRVADVPATPVARKLVRRPEGKVIAGVCTGLAAFTGVDPVAWRIAFVVLAIFGGGTGLVAYIVAWLVMPMAPEGEPTPDVRGPTFDRSDLGKWIGIGAIVLGAIVLLQDFWHFRGGIFWGLLLVGIGIALWGRELGPRQNGRGPRPNNPKPDLSATSSAPTSELPTSIPPAVPPVPPPPTHAAASSAPAPSPSRPARVREPSVLGRLVVGAAALAVGIGVLLDNLDVLNVTPKGMFAVLLAIVGTGLIIGTWVGRARWLIFPGLVLLVALSVTSILPASVVGPYGEVLWQPTSRSELRPRYEHGAGQAVLDLSQVRWGDKDKFIDVNHGFGELLVVVPPEVPVDVTAHVQGGEMTLFGDSTPGWDVDQHVVESGDTDLGKLDLDIQMNFGEIHVRRARPDDDLQPPSGRNDRSGFRVDLGPGPRVEVDNDRGNR